MLGLFRRLLMNVLTVSRTCNRSVSYFKGHTSSCSIYFNRVAMSSRLGPKVIQNIWKNGTLKYEHTFLLHLGSASFQYDSFLV